MSASGIATDRLVATGESADAHTATRTAGSADWSLLRALAKEHPNDFRRRLAQLAQTGHCRRPIRLRGEVFSMSGPRVRTHYSTRNEPGGVLLVRCRNRRAAICPSCAWEYQGDVWQLIYAGVAGGRKGVPEEIALHPMVFVTLTAPSFGRVHTRRSDGSCHRHPGLTTGSECPHGRPARCLEHHPEDDPILGVPLCDECYDYEGAVRFNWHAPELWRRFVIATRRELARQTGTSEFACAARYRLSFAKVAEFQRRGVVHFHAILRLDGTDGPFAPTDDHISAEDLCAAAEAAATRVWVDGSDHRSATRATFGQQTQVRQIQVTDDGLAPDVVAAYLAKYSSKSADDLVAEQADGARSTACDPRHNHLRLMAATAQLLDAYTPGTGHWSHMLGFRGHFASKSRSFSTTLGALRRARTAYRARGQRQPADRLRAWSFAGSGHRTRFEHALATLRSDKRIPGDQPRDRTRYRDEGRRNRREATARIPLRDIAFSTRARGAARSATRASAARTGPKKE